MKQLIAKTACNLLFTFLFLIFSTLTFAGIGKPFDKIVFFGDSLTDNGNLYNLVFGYLPKSPPYFQGRFSNGTVWSETFAQDFLDKYAITSSNYAYGGQTAVFHNPVNGFMPYTFAASIENYIVRSAYTDRSTTLFIIWIGANDYLHGATDVDYATTAVTDKIKMEIENLISRGAKNFLVMNMPNLSYTPFSKVTPDIDGSPTMDDIFSALTRVNNYKLKARLKELQAAYQDTNIQLFDINQVFTDVFEQFQVINYGKSNPFDALNLTESCWRGGYTYRVNLQRKPESIKEDLANYINQQKTNSLRVSANRLDIEATANYIESSPELMETFNVAKSIQDGQSQMCPNPDKYFFWDRIHPTHVVHNMFAQMIVNYVEQNYQHVLKPR